MAADLERIIVADKRRLDRVVTMKAKFSVKPNMRERILATIRSIPRGRVSTYGGVAKAAGFPGAARQVVAALRGAMGLPWQRVLGAGGAIKLRGDYAFEQRFRLEAEGVTFRGRKVDMKLHEHKFPKPKKKAG